MMKPLALYASLALSIPLVACADSEAGPSGPVKAAEEPRMSMAQAEIEAAARGRTSRGFEDDILRLERRVPGLGGVFVDGDGSIVVYVKNAQDIAGILRELRTLAPTLTVHRSLRDRLGVESQTAVREGDFAFSELVAWVKTISSQARFSGVVSIDADEARNRVRITMAEGAALEPARAALRLLSIPENAVVFEFGPLIQSGVTLRDRIRPTAGGLRIMNASSGECSLGFNVDMQYYGQKGFLTASHCAPSSVGSGGTGAPIYQNTVSTSNLIGSVHLNPPWNRTDYECRGYSLCTEADVMYVEAANYSSTEWAKRIARGSTVGTNSNPGNISVAGYFTGASVFYTPYVGLSVDKVGLTTGQTRGKVAATCEYPLVDSLTTPYVVLCADRVDGAAAGKGDSGGPVFYPPVSPDPTWAIGVFFGFGGSAFATIDGRVRCTAGCRYYYTPWNNFIGHFSRYFAP